MKATWRKSYGPKPYNEPLDIVPLPQSDPLLAELTDFLGKVLYGDLTWKSEHLKREERLTRGS